jgi:hypothetical protein
VRALSPASIRSQIIAPSFEAALLDMPQLVNVYLSTGHQTTTVCNRTTGLSRSKILSLPPSEYGEARTASQNGTLKQIESKHHGPQHHRDLPLNKPVDPKSTENKRGGIYGNHVSGTCLWPFEPSIEPSIEPSAHQRPQSQLRVSDYAPRALLREKPIIFRVIWAEGTPIFSESSIPKQHSDPLHNLTPHCLI